MKKVRLYEVVKAIYDSDNDAKFIIESLHNIYEYQKTFLEFDLDEYMRISDKEVSRYHNTLKLRVFKTVSGAWFIGIKE